MSEDGNPENDFNEMLRRLFGGMTPGAEGAPFDAAEFSRMAGVPLDPAMMSQLFQQMQGAFAAGGEGGVSWDLARTRASQIAQDGALSATDQERASVDQALALASLWLGESTTISDLGQAPRVITRAEWVAETLPVWQELAGPVATSIADALTATLHEQVPEEMQPMLHGAGQIMRSIGGSLFATQLGEVVGRLSREVISGGDVGLPVMPAGEAAILPQNFADFGRDLEIASDQLALYVAARELAHARLFRHAKWLRLHVISQVTEFARGIRVDTDALEELAGRFDPSKPEELRAALESGALLPAHSESQRAALDRLENLLATVEGWVDVVTRDATARLPQAEAIAETVRRRRAAGGPAERALGSLVGLELRPRRLREAAAMWRAVTDEVGVEARDALWDYPDFMPGSADIDDPGALIARIRARSSSSAEAPVDEIDDAIARILAGEEPPTDGPGAEDGTAPKDGPAPEDGTAEDGPTPTA